MRLARARDLPCLLTGASHLGITLSPTPGIAAGPIDEENFFEWEAMLTCVIICLRFVFFLLTFLVCL